MSVNRFVKYGYKDLGLILGAYEFGSRPPLEGGGIFQPMAQYGAGVKLHVTPRLIVRTDYRETLSKQPEFWAGVLQVVSPDGTFNIAPQPSEGLLRQRVLTIGVGIGF
jgi:hypothetical protein